MPRSIAPLALLLVMTSAPAVRADTVPCTHRLVAKKALEFFNYVQTSRKTGFHGASLEGQRETAQEVMAAEKALRRFCEADVLVDGGDRVHVWFAVTSRDDFKKDRPEDVQACWETPRYGEPAVIGAKSGCGPVKAPAEK